MPVSRLTAEGLSDQVAAIYGTAEVRLLALIASHLAKGSEAPEWAEAKLAELQVFRKRASKIVGEATAQAQTAAGDVIQRAYLRGAAAGQGDLAGAGITLDSPPQQAERAAEALVRAHADTLEAIGPQVVRGTADAYRDAVVRASGITLTGAGTRLDAAQHALDDLARKGITGFVDANGRKWGIESYVDMATRTTTAQAAVAGHLDRLEQAGIELMIVSKSSRECPLCAKWEGKVLSRGPVPAQATNVLTGVLEPVQIDGTLREATSAGLFHPNCTHNVSAYIHGATKREPVEHNAEGYAEKQRQRALERRLREWKRREASAMTPEAKRRARAKVREWQAAIRDHVDATGLPRKYQREAFDVRPHTPGAYDLDLVHVDQLDNEVIDQAMRELMEAGDYGPRFERLAGELDRRDQVAQTLGISPDAVREQEALNRMLFGTPHPELRDLTGTRIAKTAEQIEKELRDEYDTWVHSMWLRAEADCRGSLLSREAVHENLDPVRLFTRNVRNLQRYASKELQEWFAQPGNQRLSFPEFRAGRMDDKKAREARQRQKNRGWESEYG